MGYGAGLLCEWRVGDVLVGCLSEYVNRQSVLSA